MSEKETPVAQSHEGSSDQKSKGVKLCARCDEPATADFHGSPRCDSCGAEDLAEEFHTWKDSS